MNDYLYDVDEAQYSFVRVPKLLLQHEAFQRISSEAKLLYSLLLDRVGLSHKNGWRDKQNRIYIIYPIAEVMEEMNCGKNKAVQLLDELEQKAIAYLKQWIELKGIITFNEEDGVLCFYDIKGQPISEKIVSVEYEDGCLFVYTTDDCYRQGDMEVNLTTCLNIIRALK